MKKLAISVQTAPHESAMDFIHDYKAPANYKSQEAIDKYLEDKRATFLESKAPFNALAAEVLMVSIVGDGVLPYHYVLDRFRKEDETKHSDMFFEYFADEKSLLETLFKNLYEYAPARFTSHALHGFVLPMLLRRAWRHNIVNTAMITPDGRYYDQWKFFDTMSAWGLGNTGDEFTSLELISKHLRIYPLSGETPKAMTEPETVVARLDSDLEGTAQDIVEMLKIQLLVAERIGF